MFDPNKLLGQLLDSPGKQGFAGGVAGGLLSSMLVSKSGRKLGKKTLKYGAVAAVGALAYNAYRKHQQSKAAVPAGQAPAPIESGAELPPEASGFLPPAGDAAAASSLGMTLIRAMIAAARADGKLDPAESQAIFSRLEESDLTPGEKGALVNELSRPASVDTLAEAVRTPQEAMEVYVASLLAIEVDTPAEKAYLSLLAARLGLEEDLVARLHEEVGAA